MLDRSSDGEATLFRTGGDRGIRKSPRERDAISSGTNETRVLEIEAVDGRNRSHASPRVEQVSSQDDVCIPHASRGAPWITALTRPGAKSSGETVCGASSFSTPKNGRVGWRAQARNQSIRWKTFRVEAASSLHWGGERAALAVQVFSGDGVERRRGRSVGWARKGLLDESVVARPTGIVGRDRESGAYDELSPDGAGRGCLQATGDVRGRRIFRGEGSPSGNNARRVSVANVERRASNGSSRS